MDKVKRKFPENESIGLEEDILPDILRVAIRDYIEHLTKQQIGFQTRTVVRPHNGGMAWVEVKYPNYPQWIEGEIQKEALKLDGVSAFFNYVWQRGEMPRSFTGPNSTRHTWEVALIWDVLHKPILGILNFSALRQAVDSGKVNDPWAISDELLDQCVNELTKRYCRGLQTIVARCPLAWFKLDPGTSVDFGNGLTLHCFDEPSKALYLSQTDNCTLWNDSISKLIGKNIAVLELRDEIEMSAIRHGRQPKTGNDLIKEIVANKLDIFKWALVIALESNIAPIEGTITYGGLFGEHIGVSSIGSMRREDKSGGTVFELKEREDAIRQFLSKGLAWYEKSKDVQAAFWYWGRAALTDLNRDRLLESVIGLEHLLITNSGESRYRFGLHGASLLSSSGDNAIDKAKELRKIYAQRSSAAHGSADGSFGEANIAHKALGELIAVVLHFYETGRINTEDRFAKQLETNILTKAWLNPYEV